MDCQVVIGEMLCFLDLEFAGGGNRRGIQKGDGTFGHRPLFMFLFLGLHNFRFRKDGIYIH